MLRTLPNFRPCRPRWRSGRPRSRRQATPPSPAKPCRIPKTKSKCRTCSTTPCWPVMTIDRVTRAGQHGVVEQVLNFDFVFGIRQGFAGLGGVAWRRDLGLPLRHLGLHGLKFGSVRSIEILQFVRIGPQVVEFGSGSFDQLSIVGA